MSCLYVTEQGSKISVSEGKIIIVCKDGMRREIPEEIVESIMVFGNVDVTHGALKRILEKGNQHVFSFDQRTMFWKDAVYFRGIWRTSQKAGLFER